MHKTIRVTTNDPQRQEVSLGVGGQVKPFAVITPKHIRLFGNTGEPLKETVTIVPEPDTPFKILRADARSGGDIRYRISEDGAAEQHKYLLTVENTRQLAGRYFDIIYLTTDSAIKSKIQIQVFGNIKNPAADKSVN